jgi:MarR family transcriptional regulator, organic hydroperoxide resistance regulator
LTEVNVNITIYDIKFHIEEKGDRMNKMIGGYQALQIRLLNGRIFQKLLSKEPDAQYRSEQGKILTVLWQKEDGRATATDIALASGLANNTLTSMIKKLEDQGLVTVKPCTQDKRRKFVSLTELGWSQKEIGDRVSKELGEIFYQGFSNQEIRDFEAFQERIIENLKAKENDM